MRKQQNLRGWMFGLLVWAGNSGLQAENSPEEMCHKRLVTCKDQVQSGLYRLALQGVQSVLERCKSSALYRCASAAASYEDQSELSRRWAAQAERLEKEEKKRPEGRSSPQAEPPPQRLDQETMRILLSTPRKKKLKNTYTPLRSTTKAGLRRLRMEFAACQSIGFPLSSRVDKDRWCQDSHSFPVRIPFATDQSTPLPGATEQILAIVRVLRPNLPGTLLPPDARLLIVGHTDRRSSYEYNLHLSKRRAEAVKDALAFRRVPASQIFAEGISFDEPLADNGSPRGRALNRRVEFYILRPKRKD